MQPGALIGKYRLLEKLGSGGMGTVYRAEDSHLKRLVALKVLQDSSVSNSVERFQQEARSASSLNHPHICTVYDAGEDGGIPYLVMELLEGQTLAEKIALRPLPIATILQLGIQISGALECAHENGIVHRDLKPTNIFLTENGEPKLLDFGISKRMMSAPDPQDATGSVMMTAEGNVLGTVHYMSPEQAQGKPVDARSDLFSFGAVLYEMATARPAFPGDSAAMVLSEILRGNPAPAQSINREVPEELDRIIGKALEKDPADRYQSAKEMAVDLRRLSRRLSGHVSGEVATQTTALGGRRKYVRWGAGVAAALLLAVVIALAVSSITSSTTGPLDSEQLTFSAEPKDGPLFTDGARLYFESRGAPVQMPASGGDLVPMKILDPGMRLLDISADASKVLAIKPDAGDNMGRGALWEAPALGGTARKLSDHLAQEGRWSPDGRSILFADLNSIYSADADGAGEKKIWEAPGFLDDLSFSPDGRQIAATAHANNSPDRIWIMQADGMKPHLLPLEWPADSSLYSGTWTADGRHFVFSSDRDDVTNVYEVVSPPWFEFWKKPGAVRLTGNQVSIRASVPSTNGKNLFVIGQLAQGQMEALDLGSERGAREAATGAASFVPFLNGVAAYFFVVSPDRQWIAYSTYPSGNLWKCRLDGTDRTQLTHSFTAMEQWSPDSKTLAYSDWNKIYLVSVDGGVPEKLLAQGDREVAPTWSADGKSISFNYFPDPAHPLTGIHVVDLATRTVSDMPGTRGLYVPTWSPDHRYMLAIGQQPARMMLYTAETKQWRVIHRYDAPWGYWAWAPDSKSIYAAMTQGENGIYRMTVPEGTWTKVAGLDSITLPSNVGVFSWLSVTPSGQPAIMSDTSVTQIYALHWKH